MRSSAAFPPAQSTSADCDWENCWEAILRMPIDPLNNAYLFSKARSLVLSCLSRHGYSSWFADQLADAKLFVTEQRDLEPGSPEWQRIDVVLAGAQAGLAEALRPKHRPPAILD